jgi:hypothetical protein
MLFVLQHEGNMRCSLKLGLLVEDKSAYQCLVRPENYDEIL